MSRVYTCERCGLAWGFNGKSCDNCEEDKVPEGKGAEEDAS